MSDEEKAGVVARRLRQLINTVDLAEADRYLADQCLRQLEQPLRLTVFGSDPNHAISLANLMIGQPVLSASADRVRARFLHGDAAFARLQFPDGTQRRIEQGDFQQMFDEKPAKVRVHIDLPVLKKLSILVATEADPEALCADVDKTLPGSDIAIWAGGELAPSVAEAWHAIPDRLRSHSYLVLPQDMDASSWDGIASQFVDVLRVDPSRAQEAKTRPSGVDKVAFKEAGGTQLVRTVKKEIDLVLQAALDAGEVLLARHAHKLIEGRDNEASPTIDARYGKEVPGEDPSIGRFTESPEDVDPEDSHMPFGKITSRSKLLNTPTQGKGPSITSRTVALAEKNMPKANSRTMSKSAPQQRIRSRRSRPSATPWSLGL